MHPRTEELLRHLDTNRDVLSAAVTAVPATLREIRPAPDRWSVANVLEHLTRVEEQLTRLLSHRLAEARAAGALPPETRSSSVLESIDLGRILDRTSRVAASERVHPGGMESAAALAGLERSRIALRALLESYDGLDLSGMTFPHPVLGVIDGYAWFAFIGAHEARHAAQIREIGQLVAAASPTDGGRRPQRGDPAHDIGGA